MADVALLVRFRVSHDVCSKRYSLLLKSGRGISVAMAECPGLFIANPEVGNAFNHLSIHFSNHSVMILGNLSTDISRHIALDLSLMVLTERSMMVIFSPLAQICKNLVEKALHNTNYETLHLHGRPLG